MKVSFAIVLGAALIAVTLLFLFRWEISGVGGQAYRLDRWTGRITSCNVPSALQSDGHQLGFGFQLRCSSLTPTEAKTGVIDPTVP
jgi:hypothetical protein